MFTKYNSRVRINRGIVLNAAISRNRKKAVLKALQMSPSPSFCLEEGRCNIGPDEPLLCLDEPF